MKSVGTGKDLVAMAAKIVADHEGAAVEVCSQEAAMMIAVLMGAAEVCLGSANDLSTQLKAQGCDDIARITITKQRPPAAESN